MFLQIAPLTPSFKSWVSVTYKNGLKILHKKFQGTTISVYVIVSSRDTIDNATSGIIPVRKVWGLIHGTRDWTWFYLVQGKHPIQCIITPECRSQCLKTTTTTTLSLSDPKTDSQEISFLSWPCERICLLSDISVFLENRQGPSPIGVLGYKTNFGFAVLALFSNKTKTVIMCFRD